MIRLLVTDGNVHELAALQATLASAMCFGVVGAAATGPALLALLPHVAATVLLLDLSLPGTDVFALLSVLASQYPRLRILARGELTDALPVARAFELGTHGYLLKSTSLFELEHAVKAVAAGRPFLTTALSLHLLDRPGSAPPPLTALDLSGRELEVLKLIAEGLTNGEISDKLFTSKRTIETHRQNIIAKTQAKNTAALIRFAMLHGLLPN